MNDSNTFNNCENENAINNEIKLIIEKIKGFSSIEQVESYLYEKITDYISKLLLIYS